MYVCMYIIYNMYIYIYFTDIGKFLLRSHARTYIRRQSAHICAYFQCCCRAPALLKPSNKYVLPCVSGVLFSSMFPKCLCVLGCRSQMIAGCWALLSRHFWFMLLLGLCLALQGHSSIARFKGRHMVWNSLVGIQSEYSFEVGLKLRDYHPACAI